MEHAGIVVDDLAAATAFFVELGLKLQGEGRSRAVGLTAWWAGDCPANPWVKTTLAPGFREGSRTACR